MNCPRCQHENIENQTFCSECGSQLIPDPAIGPVDLEHIRFEFERAKWRIDTDLRRREVELKETEDRRRRGFFARIDPISVGIFAAALALTGNVITAWMQGEATHNLERERFEADLIKEYVKGSKPEAIAPNLQWLIDVGLVVVKARQIKLVLDRGAGPAPLTAGIPPSQGQDTREGCFFGKDMKSVEQACSTVLASLTPSSPEEASVRRRRAIALYTLSRFDDVIKDVDRAIELDPKNKLAYVIRGRAYKDKGQLDRALADYNKALELDPTYTLAYNERGTTYESKGQFDRALADYNKALELDPKDAAVLNSRGFLSRKTGNFERAMVDFNASINADSQRVFGWRNRALSRALARDYPGAMADISKALELEPKDSRALYIRGILLELQGNIPGAAQDFTAARQAASADFPWQETERDLGGYRPKR